MNKEKAFKETLDKKLKLLEKLNNQDIPLQNKLINFLNHHFDELQKDPETIKQLVEETMLPEKNNQDINEFVKKAPVLIKGIVEEAIRKKEIREVEPELIASAIFHAIHGVTIKTIYDPNFQAPQAKKELINLFCIGINK